MASAPEGGRRCRPTSRFHPPLTGPQAARPSPRGIGFPPKGACRVSALADASGRRRGGRGPPPIAPFAAVGCLKTSLSSLSLAPRPGCRSRGPTTRALFGIELAGQCERTCRSAPWSAELHRQQRHAAEKERAHQALSGFHGGVRAQPSAQNGDGDGNAHPEVDQPRREEDDRRRYWPGDEVDRLHERYRLEQADAEARDTEECHEGGVAAGEESPVNAEIEEAREAQRPKAAGRRAGRSPGRRISTP